MFFQPKPKFCNFSNFNHKVSPIQTFLILNQLQLMLFKILQEQQDETFLHYLHHRVERSMVCVEGRGRVSLSDLT